MKKVFLLFLSLFLSVFIFTSSSTEGVITKRHMMVRGMGANAPYIDYCEIYKDGQFDGKIIMNAISDGEKLYPIYKDCSYFSTDTKFGSFYDIYDILHQYAFVNQNAWCLDLSSYDYTYTDENGDEVQVVGIEFGRVKCLCKDKEHLVFNFRTTKKDDYGGYAGKAYIGHIDIDEWVD